MKATPNKLKKVDPWYWADSGPLILLAGPFRTKGHEYQVAPLQSHAQVECFKKGAQMGFTEINGIKTLHGMIHRRYRQGALHLFPTRDDVSEFSKGRFKPLISDNPQMLGQYVQDTDTANQKRVGRGILYMRGARVTNKIEGHKKTSSQLKSIPVDRIVFDEVDEMDSAMVQLALERISHSEVQEESYLSTPTIPEYGIDALYEQTDQRVWMLRCSKCGGHTCLELEFPECLERRPDGSVIRLCQRCRDQELFPHQGEWVAQRPDIQDRVGWWISQLNSIYVSPAKILDMFNDPPNGDLAEVYNSKLGMAYIAASNRLAKGDVYACCGSDAPALNHHGPCAMGVDVGSVLHVVIGGRVSQNRGKIVYMGRVPDFEDLHDLAKRFNVKSAVIDYYPETRKVREFQEAEEFKVIGCEYKDKFRAGEKIDEELGLLTIDRTQMCDRSHKFVTDLQLEIPRRCPAVEEYAKEMTQIAKVLQEDRETGSRVYRYVRTGADHYRHATNYFILAMEELPVMVFKGLDFAAGITDMAASYAGYGR